MSPSGILRDRAVSPRLFQKNASKKIRPCERQCDPLKVTAQHQVENPDVNAGHFNRCEHLFVELAPGEYQTISVKLPNGKHVTFGFVPGTVPDDFEGVDIHSTVGAHWKDPSTVGEDHYEQKLVGFAKGGNVSIPANCRARPAWQPCCSARSIMVDPSKDLVALRQDIRNCISANCPNACGNTRDQPAMILFDGCEL